MPKVIDQVEGKTGAPALSPLGLPTKPDLLADTLRSQLAVATKRIDDALIGALQEELLGLVNAWFGRRPPEVDQGLLKRLTNALLSAGKSGADRTLASLQAISNSTWEQHVNKITSEKAAEDLRDQTADFRRASAFIDQQAKCVKTILKVVSDEATEVPKELLMANLDSASKLQDWSIKLSAFWIENTETDSKNRTTYLNFWSDFIAILVKQDVQDYADHLAVKTQKYLTPENQDIFKRHYRRIKDSTRRADDIDLAPKSLLKLDAGKASLATTFNLPGDSVQQIKEDLLFMFATDDLLIHQRLEIYVAEDDPQTLIVKFTPPKEMLTYRRVIQALNGHIEAAYSQIIKQ